MAELALRLRQFSNQENENLFPNFLTFNKDVDFLEWNVYGDGTGSGTNDEGAKIVGDRGIELVTAETDIDFEVNSDGTQTRFTAPVDGNYFFSFQVRNPTDGGVDHNDLVAVKFEKNGTTPNWLQIAVTAEMLDGVKDAAVAFFWEFALNAGEFLDTSFLLAANAPRKVYVDALKMELNNKNLPYPTTYTPPSRTKDLVNGLYAIRITDGVATYELIPE